MSGWSITQTAFCAVASQSRRLPVAALFKSSYTSCPPITCAQANRKKVLLSARIARSDQASTVPRQRGQSLDQPLAPAGLVVSRPRSSTRLGSTPSTPARTGGPSERLPARLSRVPHPLVPCQAPAPCCRLLHPRAGSGGRLGSLSMRKSSCSLACIRTPTSDRVDWGN